MKLAIIVTALIAASATTVHAETLFRQLCGPDAVNEVASAGDVRSNPAGYYIRSLATQVSLGDLRIVGAVGHDFQLCTTAAATPDMDATAAILAGAARSVKFLFVPIDIGPVDPNS